MLPATPGCVGVEPGAVALFSRALSAQGQTLVELLCSVSLQVTESFLSKEVTCVVSSNREAKRGQARPREEKQSSPTAKGTKSTSSVPAAPRGNPTRPRQKPPYTVRATKVLAQGVCGVASGASFGRWSCSCSEQIFCGFFPCYVPVSLAVPILTLVPCVCHHCLLKHAWHSFEL